MEYYSAPPKKNIILIRASIWLNLEDVMLSQIHQTHKKTNIV